MPKKAEQHKATHATGPQHDNRRRTPRRQADHAFYNSARWQRFRKMFLANNPMCSAPGCNQPATEVHHRQRLCDRPDLGLVEDNCEGLCCACHSRRTVLHDGGFGRKKTH